MQLIFRKYILQKDGLDLGSTYHQDKLLMVASLETA